MVGWFGPIGHQHLFIVGYAVLVGVGILHPRQPGLDAEIVDVRRALFADEIAKGNLAQQRIEAVEHLVVVVHAVFVGVGHSRVGAGVAVGVFADMVVTEGAVFGLDEIVGHIAAEPLACLPVVGRGGPVPVMGHAVKDLYRIVGAIAEPGHPLIILEMENGIHPVFLVVFETIAIVVEITVSAGDGVRAALGVKIGTVHAVGNARGRGRSGELEFEAVGKEVHISIDAVRIEHAARSASPDVACMSVIVSEDCSFFAVERAVTVGVEIPRIGGPELIPPTFVNVFEAIDGTALASMKLAAHHQTVAIGLQGGIKCRALPDRPDDRRGVGAAGDIKLPAVWHQVAVRVGTVAQHGRTVNAAQRALGRGVGHPARTDWLDRCREASLNAEAAEVVLFMVAEGRRCRRGPKPAPVAF